MIKSYAQPAADDAKLDICAIIYQRPKWLLNYIPDFKGGLISESFSISKNVSTDYPEPYPPKENMLWIAMLDLFWKWSKSGKNI